MSKNHPNDNIYSILGKLEALKPTPEEKRFALVKEIRESVEAKGSILSGVDAVQAKLQQQFNEAGQRRGMHGEPDLVGIPGPAKGTKPSPKAITKGADREYYKSPGLMGEPERTRWRKKTTESCNACEEGTCTMHEGTEECCCKEMGQKECPVHCDEEPRSGVKEAEITRKPGVTTHRKTDFPGYPVDDADDIDDENKGKRGRPRKHAKKEPTGLGRGRPKKAAAIGSTAPKMHDPFGRVATSATKLKGNKGRVHSMMESVNFKRMMEEQHMTISEMLEAMGADMEQFKATGVCSDRLRDMMEVFAHAKKQMADETVEQTPVAGIGNDIVDQHAKMQALTPQKPGIMGAVKDVAQGASNWLRGKPEQGPTYEDASPLDEELRQLAELAGLNTEGNAFTGKLKTTPKGSTFDVDGKEYADTSTLDEEPNEGNQFSGALAKAKAQHQTKFDVDGKEYAVKEADAPVNEPVDGELENEPNPKYGTIKNIITQGDDLNRQKRQDPQTANRAANPLTNSPMKLEAKLAAEYESIKKSSK